MTATETFYKQLQSKRKAQKISLKEISDRTKIGIIFLDAIEKGDFSKLPQVYLRLFLRSYATEIGADPIRATIRFCSFSAILYRLLPYVAEDFPPDSTISGVLTTHNTLRC